jgi:hypothetical protein
MIIFREIPEFTWSQVRQWLRDKWYVVLREGKEVISYGAFKRDHGIDKRKLQKLLENWSKEDIWKGDILTQVASILSLCK